MTSKTGLNIMGLPNLFQSISNEAQTGTLKVQCSLGTKYVFFRRGDIQQVSSPQKPSILAEGLRRHPELDEDAYQGMCERQRETGQSLASLLLAEEEGKELVVAVCQFQILEEICELFTWEDCDCEFTENEPPAMIFDMEILDIDMAMNTGMVLLEAARRYDEWKVILENFPSKHDVPLLQKELDEDVTPEACSIAALVDGFKDIEEILAEVRLSPFAAMKILAEMFDAKFIVCRTGEELLHMAKLDFFRENKSKCIKLYKRAEELGERSPEITLWLAHSYEAMGMKDQAAKQYIELGYEYLKEDKFEKSANAFEMVTRLTPDDLEAQERLVTLLNRMGKLDEYGEKATTFSRWLALKGDRRRAIFILREAIEKMPKNPEGLDFLGSLYQEEGERKNASRIYNLLAKEQISSGDKEGAIKSYQKIIIMDHDNLEAHIHLANILHNVGKHQEALDHYRTIGRKVKAMEGFNENQELANNLSSISNKIIELDPDDLTARQWLAQAHITQNKHDLAAKELDEILERVDKSENLSLLIDTLKSLVVLKPSNFTIRTRLAETYVKTKKEREAIQEYFNLGVKADELGNAEKAIEAFDKLLSYEPANYATRLKKAEILQKMEDNEMAIRELMLTGYLSMGSDKLWQAVKAFRQVLNLDRDSQIICYLELGRVYEKLNKTKEAVAAYKKHIQKSVKQSNFGDALSTCEHLLEISPNHDWAEAAKGKLVGILPKLNEVFQKSVK